MGLRNWLALSRRQQQAPSPGQFCQRIDCCVSVDMVVVSACSMEIAWLLSCHAWGREMVCCSTSETHSSPETLIFPLHWAHLCYWGPSSGMFLIVYISVWALCSLNYCLQVLAICIKYFVFWLSCPYFTDGLGSIPSSPCNSQNFFCCYFAVNDWPVQNILAHQLSESFTTHLLILHETKPKAMWGKWKHLNRPPTARYRRQKWMVQVWSTGACTGSWLFHCIM